MIIDLFHNKIVKDTATEAFVESVNSRLVPMLEEKYGDSLERITMYEDYLADGFLFEGEWYYPLSVKIEGEDTVTAWIKWPVGKKTFRNNIPYAYIGSDGVDFEFAGFVPAGFADKLEGRAIDYDRSAITLRVEAVTDDPTLLVGKYSQTFVDELASQITAELCKNLSVDSFEGSTMELQLVFAPGTYLEHTSENVTYRRLLLVDKGCQARDFWVKWTRLDGNGGFKVSDSVSAETVKFGLGEDVPQKIREKEYRFLAGANPSKYQSAMGKKTVTEWRDITKRAIKRGDLVKVELVDDSASVPVATPETFDTHVQDDVNDQLRALLGSFGVSTTAPEETVESDDTDDMFAALAKSVLEAEAESDEDFEVEIEEVEDVFEEIAFTPDDTDVPFELDEPVEETVDEPAEEVTEDEPVETAPEVEATESEIKSVFDFDFSFDEEPEEEVFSMGEITLDAYESAVEAPAEPKKAVDEDAIRREIEAKLRLEYETEARLRAEREAEQLRLEHERLREENERLAKLAREAEEKRAAEEEARRQEEEARRLAEEQRQRELEAQRAEEERLRAELEAKMRLEAEERARIAEAARMAVEEQKRLEAERAAREERERQEAIVREAERLRREEEARRLEEQRRQAEARRREEEEKRRREEEVAKALSTVVTKQAKLLFRYTVDVNVIKRIKEVVEKVLVANHKEKLNIHIKAYPQDTNSIVLEIKIPQNEMDLLVSMMKALGGASMGITKIILE